MTPGQEPIGALRNGSAVYVRVLKCASTFFNDNLLAQGWELTDYYKIDWNNDFVFAHIIDPVVRRHKGLAEYIHMCGLTQLYLTNTKLQNLLTSCVFLDRHSMPYSTLFNDRLYDIFWIPLTHDYEKNIMTTQEILNKKCQTNLTLADWDLDLSHCTDSGSDKKLVEIQLQKQWESNTYYSEKYQDHLWAELYDAIRDSHWPDAPLAKDFYNLPQHIQHEIATLHQSIGLKFIIQNNVWELHTAPDSIKTNQITAAHYNMLQKDINLYNHVLEIFDQTTYDISATKIQQSIGLS